MLKTSRSSERPSPQTCGHPGVCAAMHEIFRVEGRLHIFAALLIYVTSTAVFFFFTCGPPVCKLVKTDGVRAYHPLPS